MNKNLETAYYEYVASERRLNKAKNDHKNDLNELNSYFQKIVVVAHSILYKTYGKKININSEEYKNCFPRSLSWIADWKEIAQTVSYSPAHYYDFEDSKKMLPTLRMSWTTVDKKKKSALLHPVFVSSEVREISSFIREELKKQKEANFKKENFDKVETLKKEISDLEEKLSQKQKELFRRKCFQHGE